MNKERVHKIIQFALATARLNDDWWNHELGPIHLIKYVYLADLAHAQANDGETYTGAPWLFYNFGPWAVEVFHEIDSALEAIGAEKKNIPSDYEGDFIRWKVLDEQDAQDIKDKADLDFSAQLAVEHAVKQFGKDTEDLLHHVYTTLPMLLAAPDEHLDFGVVAREPASQIEPPQKSKALSKGRLKRRKAKYAKVREDLNRRRELKEALRKESESDQLPPKYDEVFLQGLAALDEVAGGKVPEEKFTCSISAEFWKSKARYDPDLH